MLVKPYQKGSQPPCDVCEGGLKKGMKMRKIIKLEVHEAHGLQTEISVHLP